jgi:hypothetical protein
MEHGFAHGTPGDEERKQRILANGLECLRRLHSDQSWEDWIGTGEAMLIVTENTLAALGFAQWDKDNKPLVKEFNRRWDEYERSAGANYQYQPLSKQERWALREVMTNAEISTWRAALPGPDKRRLNHPNAVINRWKASKRERRPPTPLTPREPAKPAAKPAVEIDPTSLSKTERAELAAYKRQVKSEIRRELEAQFEQRVGVEAKSMVDYSLMVWFERFKQAEAKINEFDSKISRCKPIISRKTFRILMASVQPDKGGTHEAATEFNDNRPVIEAVLCGSKDEYQRWARLALTPLPNREEFEAARERVRAENSERAKRAAAKRAARKAEAQPDMTDGTQPKPAAGP